jgi:hypothetical protein
MTAEVEALILLAQEGAQRPEEVEAAIAAMGGRIVAGFLPHALIVRVTEEAVDDLRQSLGAASVHTEAVPATVLQRVRRPKRVGERYRTGQVVEIYGPEMSVRGGRTRRERADPSP